MLADEPESDSPTAPGTLKIYRCALLVLVFAAVFIPETVLSRTGSFASSIASMQRRGSEKMTGSSQDRDEYNRCWWINETHPEGVCPCHDHRSPIPMNLTRFHNHFDEVLRTTKRNRGDVLFLGDSITERMRGTKYMGGGLEHGYPKFRTIFEQYFPNATAMATASSTTNNLLWQLKNGWLNNSSESTYQTQPRVIVLLIGTNNLNSRHQCSPNTTLAGILHLVDYLGMVRPKSQIVVHGLLPRCKAKELNATNIAGFWGPWPGRIDPLNAQLKQVARTSPFIASVEKANRSKTRTSYYYIENTDLFAPNMVGLMKDCIHPSKAGFRLWMARLKTQLDKLTNEGQVHW